MITITHLGVGEAFDSKYYNNSHLVETSTTALLLDCGYQIPQQLFRCNQQANFIDYIYISHLHADHYFGLPPLLVWMAEEQRNTPLTILTGPNTTEKIQKIIALGYPGFPEKLPFKLTIQELNEKEPYQAKDIVIHVAPTQHSVQNFAISLAIQHKKISYSGDGKNTAASAHLYHKSDVLIHEAYTYDEPLTGHSNTKEILEMAKKEKIKKLLLCHMQRNKRKQIINKLEQEEKKELEILIPRPNQSLQL